jgi:hypothetical protein
MPARVASDDLPVVQEHADYGAENPEDEFAFTEDEAEEEEEDALTVAARLGCMLLENKAELEAQIEELQAAVEEHRAHAEDLRLAVREYAAFVHTSAPFH